MAITFVGELGTKADGAQTTTWTISPTANATSSANTVIMMWHTRFVSSSPYTAAITDTKGNTWTVDATWTDGHDYMFTASTPQNGGALTTSDTVTVTTNVATNTNTFACLQEFSGPLTYNGSNANSASGVTTQAVNAVTPTLDNCLLLAMSCHQSKSQTYTINGTGTVGTYTSFPTATITSGTVSFEGVPVYQILTGGAGVAQKHAWTWSGTTWSDMTIVAYSPPATRASAGVATARVESIGAYDAGELIHYVQELSSGEDITAGTSTLTVPVNVAPKAGNTLVLVCRMACNSTGTRSMAVTDSKGNTWTIDSQDIQSAQYAFIASCRQNVAALTTSDTLTVTMTGATRNTPTFYWLEEFKNLAEADSVPNPVEGDGSSPYLSPAIVPTLNGDMAVAYIDHFSNTDTLTSNATGTVGTYVSFDSGQKKSTAGAVTTGWPVYQVLGLTEGSGVSQYHAWSATSNIWSNMIGVAYKRVVDSTNASAGVAQATVSGKSPTDTLTCSPTAGVATALVSVPSLPLSVEVEEAPAVVEAFAPTVTTQSNVSADADVAEAVVTTADPGATLEASPAAGGATATAAAIGVNTALLASPDAGAAPVSGAALDPVVEVGAAGDVAEVTAAALDPAVSVGAPTGAAEAGADALDATVSTVVSVEASAGSADAEAAVPDVSLTLTASPEAGAAESAVDAQSPSVSGTTNAEAGAAAVEVEVIEPAFEYVAAGTADATGAAYDADVEIVGSTHAHAGVADSATLALDASATGEIQPEAGNVTAIAAANGAFAAIGAQAGTAEAVVEVEGAAVSTSRQTVAGKAAATVAGLKPSTTLTLDVSTGVAGVAADGYAPEVISGYSATAGVAEATVEVEGATTFGTLEITPNASEVVVAALDPRAETATVFHQAPAGCAVVDCAACAITQGGTPVERRVTIEAESRAVDINGDSRVDDVEPESRAVYAYVI